MSNPPFVSVIVTTYNWPTALAKVVEGLSKQSYTHFEVLIADDGSSKETMDCVEYAKKKFSLEIQHIWQPDDGFQAARIRNKAVAKAKGDYLIFIDNDCVPLPHFVQRHIELAETGWLVAGNRILLNKEFTEQIFVKDIALSSLTLYNWLLLRKKGYCNRLLPLLFLPWFPRKNIAQEWRGAKACNLALWKKDFFKVNGFDESFQGWGHEDSDLVIRLFRAGIRRKDGRFALPVIHLWHQENDRSKQKENFERFLYRLSDDMIQATLGINQYSTSN